MSGSLRLRAALPLLLALSARHAHAQDVAVGPPPTTQTEVADAAGAIAPADAVSPPPSELGSEASVDQLLDQMGAVAEPEQPYPRLSLYGFADFTLGKIFVPEDNLVSLYIPSHTTFAVGNINLYIDSQLSRRARSLIEARMSFVPDGAVNVDASSGTVYRTSTNVNDYRILGRYSKWGSLAIERAVLSYDLTSWLTLTVGRLITPWGIWNVDHGSPSLISVVSPLFVDGQYIPTRQTGVQASGRFAWPGVLAGYFLTVSNGRGPIEEYRDFDENKAVGGRVFGTFTRKGELTLGFTFYVGRETNPVSQRVDLPADGSRARILTPHKVSVLEKSLAADLKWEYRGLLVMAEFVASGKSYDDKHRAWIDSTQGAISGDGRPQIAPDALRYGGYLLVGHRFRWLGLMPFANFEYNDDAEAFLNRVLMLPQVGINMRPEPGLVVKLVGSVVWFQKSEPRFFGPNPHFWGIHSQVAWAF